MLETVRGFTKLSIPKFLLNDDKLSLFLRRTHWEGGFGGGQHLMYPWKKSSRVAKFQKYIDRVATK
jgi:hypothetical protein